MSETNVTGNGAQDLGTRTPEHMIDPPPLMKTWRRFYGLVLFVLGVDILVFWIVTRVFS